MDDVQRKGLEERDFDRKLLYLKVYSYVQERAYLRLGINMNLISADVNEQYLHRLMVLSGLVVQEPRAEWIDQVNEVRNA